MINAHRSFTLVVGVGLALIILASGFFLRRVGGANDNDQTTQTAPAAKNLLAAKLGQAYALGDFNGDSLTDVAAPDFVSDTVSVMVGDRAGYFHSVTRLSSGGPRAIVAADFNRDGAIDLAVVGFFSGDVAIFPGRGDGGFHDSRSIRLSEGLTSLIAEDFNSDGLLDLAAANYLSGEIVFLKGSGDGSFGEQAVIGQIRAPTLILSRDFDRDGLQDLIAFGASEKEARLFTGEGNGYFKDAGNVDAATAISFERSQGLNGDARLSGESRLLRKLIGDGQSAPANTALPQPLVIEVGEQGESSRAGRQVTFSMLHGDGRLEANDARTTDERGQASLALSLGELPGNNLVAAAAEGQVTVFGESSTFYYADFFAKIKAAFTHAPSAQSGLRQRHALLDEAERRLSAGDEIGAITSLMGNIELLSDRRNLQPGGHRAMSQPVDLLKRMLNQALLFGAASPASPTEAISCGETKTNRALAPGQQDTYTFSGNAGEAVILTAVGRSGNVCVYAELYRAGIYLGRNSCNSYSSSLTLPANDTYTILVYDSGLNDTGAYDLNLQFTTGRCGSAIACGQTLSGNLTSKAQQDTYKFSANAGEAVMFSAVGSSGNVCAYAELYSPSGVYLGRNSCNSNSSSLSLPASGAYTILVYDSGHDGTGAYDFNLQFTSGRCGTSIACGQTKSGNLASKAQQDSYAFNGIAGEAILITAVATSSANFCAYAELYDPSGKYLGRNSCNSYSSSLTLPANGAYTILVYDSGLNDTGAYDLNLQFTTGRCGAAITCGQTLSGNLTSKAQQDTFSFCGVAGSSVIVSAVGASGNVCVYAELYDPSGVYRGRNSCNSNSSSLSLPASGAYTVLVYDSGHDGTGAYNVNLSCIGNTCPTPPFSVSGRVTDAIGNGISGVTMNFTRVSGTGTVPASVVTDNGNWNQTGFQSGTTYRVTPVKTGCTFNPTSRDFNGARSDLNFTGDCPSGCPAAQIEIIPPNPTANDSVSIRISGSWPNACAPRNPVVVPGPPGEIRINTSNPGQFCAQVFTSYNLTVPVGRLDPRTYQVIVTHSYPGGQCELGRKSFTVTGNCIAVSLPSTLSGSAGSSLMVPITVSDLTNRGVVSYDFTVAFDPSILRLSNMPVDKTGTLSSAMTITTNNNTPGRLTVSAFGTAPLSGAGTLLFLKFDLIGANGSCSSLTWTSFRFNEGTPCATLTNGRVCVSQPSGSISGTVSYCISPKPVPGVVMTATGTPSKTSTTNSSGIYQLTELGGGSYTVTPTKTGDVNGISSFDASLVAQHVAGLITLTSCQQIAGDGSCIGGLSSFDASLIAQFAAGISPTTGCVGMWKFAPPNRSYPSVTGNLTNQNFDAVLVGDVSGNWSPSASGLAPVAKLRANLVDEVAQAPISLPTTSGTSGSSVTIPITVGDLTGRGYVAYDFDITFNNAVLQLQNPPIDAAGTLSGAMNITHNATPGRLRVSAFGTAALAGAGTLLNLKFNVVGAPGSSTDLTWQRFLFNEEAQTNLVHGRFTVASPLSTPTVTTSAASPVSNTGATLNGSVKPNGLATNIWFEWGPNCALANTTPSHAVGSGTTNIGVSATLSGLTPGTTYCYRLAGTNSAGTTRGSTLNFTTLNQTPTLALSFNGKARDRVGPGETALSPDGFDDGVFTITFPTTSGGTKTIIGLDLTRSGGGRWNTTPGDGLWVIGAAGSLDAPLFNSPNGTVNFSVAGGGSFNLFASDNNNSLFNSGDSFTLTVNFADGTSASGATTIQTLPFTLGFDGKLRDRVGPGETALGPDGLDDGVFTVTFPTTSGGTKTITGLDLTRSGGGRWNTTPGDGLWVLGAAVSLGDPLLNSSTGAVDFIFRVGSFNLFASDNNNSLFNPGDSFTLTVSFADGTTATASAMVSAGTARANNLSAATDCAEEDNGNVTFTGQVATFTIEASHPTYPVTDYSCAPDFSNCSPPISGFPFTPGVFKLFDDGETVVEAVREASWWRPNGMAAAVDDRPQAPDVHYIRLYRRIAGASEYPQVLVLYQDGNLRLIPQPPVGASSVCFGSSVIVGPAAPARRPIAEIVSVVYFSVSRTLEIRYRDGGTAIIILRDVNRDLTRVQVNVNYPTDLLPFATFRSMFVAEGNADVDHVKWVDAAGVMRDDPILTFPGGVGTEWFFYRQTRSRHNTSAPDIRIRLETRP